MESRTTLNGSERKYHPGRKGLPMLARQRKLEINLYLKDRQKEEPIEKFSTRKDKLNSFEISVETIIQIEKFASKFRLKILEISGAERKVRLSGTIKAMETAFGINMEHFEFHEGNYLSHEDPLSIPAELAEHVLGVTGLHQRSMIRPASLGFGSACDTQPPPGYLGKCPSGFPRDMAALYDFPTDLDGSGQKVALIELGGGYRKADLEKYFREQDLRVPEMVDVSVRGGTNKPGRVISLPTMEVYLNISVVGSITNKAKLIVYFAGKDTIDYLIDAIAAAVYDKQNQPDIISVSWVWIEKEWNSHEISILERILQDAADLGITVIAASGDFGSSFRDPGFVNVAYPTSSPYVLGCGATVVLVNEQNEIIQEYVWSTPPGLNQRGNPCGASGGGVSAIFERPEWQKSADVPPASGPVGGFIKRGVPDISASVAYYWTFVLGQIICQGGTSAVAPLMAAAIAMVNQKAGSNIGCANPALYNLQIEAKKQLCRTIEQGSNGAYFASVNNNYNACVGLGVPNGTTLVHELAAYTKAKNAKTQGGSIAKVSSVEKV